MPGILKTFGAKGQLSFDLKVFLKNISNIQILKAFEGNFCFIVSRIIKALHSQADVYILGVLRKIGALELTAEGNTPMQGS